MKKESFKKIFAWVIVFTFILNTFPASSSSAGEIADSVYMNGNIYTMDEEQPNAVAIAVKGQKLIFVGSNENVKSYIGNNTKITDLKGKTVIPGLMEGHIHLPMLGENLMKVDAFWKPKAEAQLLSYGLTSIMDAGSNMATINQYHDLYKAGNLKIRLYSLIGGDWGGTIGEAEREYVSNNPPQKGLYDNRLSINAVKFYADGSLGSRSAALLKDYSDRAGHIGNYKFNDEQIYNEMKDSYNKGYQLATHAIGDGAVNQVINTYEKLMKANPRADARLRIEHFQIAQVSDIQRIADLKILPAMQPTHATSDKTMAEDRIGAERMKGAYAWRKVIESGNIIVGGSDAPVELVNPYHGLYAAVTRQGRDGQPEGGWYAGESMTREEALKAFTIWTAYGQFEEDLKGSLKAGKLADFVIIDRDYMKCPANEIKDIQALTTVLGGETVYQKDTSKASVIWQGVPISFSASPVIRDGKLYVEAAALADKLGATVSYTEGSFELSMTKGDKTLKLTVVPAGDQEMVPIREVLEGFEYSLVWNILSKSVSID